MLPLSTMTKNKSGNFGLNRLAGVLAGWQLDENNGPRRNTAPGILRQGQAAVYNL
jgi:hypothetical protein